MAPLRIAKKDEVFNRNQTKQADCYREWNSEKKKTAVGLIVSNFPQEEFFWDRCTLPLGVHKDTLRDSLDWSMAQLRMHKILQSVSSTNPEGSIAFEQMF